MVALATAKFMIFSFKLIGSFVYFQVVQLPVKHQIIVTIALTQSLATEKDVLLTTVFVTVTGHMTVQTAYTSVMIETETMGTEEDQVVALAEVHKEATADRVDLIMTRSFLPTLILLTKMVVLSIPIVTVDVMVTGSVLVSE